MFSDEAINETLVHEYVVMYLANQRQNTAKAKTRGEIV
jgi:ribosomal protein L4